MPQLLTADPDDVNSDTELDAEEKVVALNAARSAVNSNPALCQEDDTFHTGRKQALPGTGLRLFMDQGEGARAASSSPALTYEQKRQEFEMKRKSDEQQKHTILSFALHVAVLTSLFPLFVLLLCRKRAAQEENRTVGTAYEMHLLKQWLLWRKQMLKLLEKQWDRSNIPLINTEQTSRHLPDTPSKGGIEDKEKTTNRDIIMLQKDMAELQALMTGKLQRHFDKVVKSFVIESEYGEHYKRRIKAKVEEIEQRNKVQEKERQRRMKASEAYRNKMGVMLSGKKVDDGELKGHGTSLADLMDDDELKE